MAHNEHTINDTYNDFFKNQEIQIKMDKFISKESMITLYAKQKKRHRCTEQTFRLWEKARVGCSERTALKQVYYQG